MFVFGMITNTNVQNVSSSLIHQTDIHTESTPGSASISQPTYNHGPILINRTSDFTSANGVTKGTGTKNDPFIIENWNIESGNPNGISIINSNVYVSIINCSVGIYDQKNRSVNGLFLNNTEHVVAINNTFIYVDYGIYLNNARDNTFLNNTSNWNGFGIYVNSSCNYNTFLNNTSNWNGFGIYVNSSCNYNTFLNNTSNWNVWEGINCKESDNNIFSGNLLYKNYEMGFFIDSIHNCIIINNVINANWNDGIFVYRENSENSTNNTIANNIVMGNYYGITLGYFNNCTVFNNTIFKNGMYGIFLDSSDDNLISNNNISNTHNCGIEIAYSNNNIIWNNSFIDNSGAQTEGGSSHNQWYYNKTGNYYSDYLKQHPLANNNGRIWNIPYKIGGNNTDVDRYPLCLGDHITTIKITVNIMILILSIFAITFSLFKLLKWRKNQTNPSFKLLKSQITLKIKLLKSQIILKINTIIRIMQIIGLILTFIGVILSILGFKNTNLLIKNTLHTHPIYTLCSQVLHIYMGPPLLAWHMSIVFIIAGMILFLISTISLFLIKDNNQKKRNLKTIRINQIIGLIWIFSGAILSILGFLKTNQSIISISGLLPTFCDHGPFINIDQIPLLTWCGSIVFIIVGMILFLIATISLFRIKDNNQKTGNKNRIDE